MGRAKWIVALAAVVLIGVGSAVLLNVTSEDSVAGSPGASGTAAGSQAALSPDKGSSGSPGTSRARSTAASPRPSFDPSQLKAGDLSLELVVEPSCASRGDALTARLKAVPGAYVSLIISYADGQSYSTWYAGPTAPDGTLTYPWVVPPNAAKGAGYAFASGYDPASERAGNVAVAFQIAGAEGC